MSTQLAGTPEGIALRRYGPESLFCGRGDIVGPLQHLFQNLAGGKPGAVDGPLGRTNFAGDFAYTVAFEDEFDDLAAAFGKGLQKLIDEFLHRGKVLRRRAAFQGIRADTEWSLTAWIAPFATPKLASVAHFIKRDRGQQRPEAVVRRHLDLILPNLTKEAPQH